MKPVFKARREAGDKRRLTAVGLAQLSIAGVTEKLRQEDGGGDLADGLLSRDAHNWLAMGPDKISARSLCAGHLVSP